MSRSPLSSTVALRSMASRKYRHAWSPSDAARFVESTMSVNSTVVRIRSAAGNALPVALAAIGVHRRIKFAAAFEIKAPQ